MEYNTKNIAGIVSTIGPSLDFKLEWPEYMMPVTRGMLAVERSVLECAYAGCSSIWIVCNQDTAPLLRHRMRDFIDDPCFNNFKFKNKYGAYVKQKRNVPIFYVPMHAKYRDRVDSLGFSILHGAKYAQSVGRRLSKFVEPVMFYTSFPYGTYEPKTVRAFRKPMIRGMRVMAMHDGKSVKDNEYLGFSFKPEDMQQFIDIVRAGARRTFRNENNELEKLPIEDRYEAKNYTLDKIYGGYNPDEIFTKTIKWYHNISKWDSYRKFLGSDHSFYLGERRPIFIHARRFEEINYTLQEEENDGSIRYDRD